MWNIQINAVHYVLKLVIYGSKHEYMNASIAFSTIFVMEKVKHSFLQCYKNAIIL